LKFSKWAVLIVVLISSFNQLEAQSKKGIFRDSIDNAFDISKWLLDLHGFLPIVSPITEPAVGYGAIGAAVYFIPKEKKPGVGFQMPDIAGVAGGLTQNGTWLSGAGYFGFWKDNAIRYRGVLGYADFKLKYYGTGGGFLATNPVQFTLQSYVTLQQFLFRIGKSNFMVGGNYIFSKTKVILFEENDIDWLDPLDFDLINSGVSLRAQYETFNNLLSPSKGVSIQLEYRTYLEFLGSDRHSDRVTFSTVGYVPVMDRWVSGFRLESVFASQNTPFYMLPFVYMRGVPAMRYQGRFTILAETEQYVRVYRRWGLIGFAGYGRSIANIERWDGGDHVWNAGGGFRYLMARQLGLQMGIDVGCSPEEWAIYIVFASAWLR